MAERRTMSMDSPRHFGVNASGNFSHSQFFSSCSQSKDLFRKIEDDEGNSRSINSMEPTELEREMNKQRKSNFHEFLHVFFVVSVLDVDVIVRVATCYLCFLFSLLCVSHVG